MRGYLLVIGCAVAVVILLWIPVAGDRITASVSRQAPRVAPRIFFAGLGFLALGIVARFEALIIVGACLIGILVLGAFIDNY